MIKIENTEVYGFEAAIRGMRNPMNSWDKSDSQWEETFGVSNDMSAGFFKTLSEIERNYDLKEAVKHDYELSSYRDFIVGSNDLNLTKQLVKAGTDHSKFMRMINVTLDITAPLYWWKEFDTYKVGTVRNSCSSMHKIHESEFTLDDFSHEHLIDQAVNALEEIIMILNECREGYLNFDQHIENGDFDAGITDKKIIWWQMIQLLPSSYNQRATVQLNYQVLRNMYHARKNHKLDEWREFCEWIETLPYSELITMEKEV